MPDHFPQSNPGYKNLTWDDFPIGRKASQTKFASFRKMASMANDHQLIIRAMNGANDLQSSQFLNVVVCCTDKLSAPHRLMVRRWIMRMGIVGIEDSLRLVEEIKSSRTYSFVMQKTEVANRFKEIKSLMPGKAEYAKRTQYISALRNKAAAHHDDHLKFAEAIRVRASSDRHYLGRSELSMDAFCTRFFLADDVLSTMLSQGVWGLTGTSDELDKSSDDVLEWIHKVSKDLGIFLVVFSLEAMKSFDLWA